MLRLVERVYICVYIYDASAVEINISWYQFYTVTIYRNCSKQETSRYSQFYSHN